MVMICHGISLLEAVSARELYIRIPAEIFILLRNISPRELIKCRPGAKYTVVGMYMITLI